LAAAGERAWRWPIWSCKAGAGSIRYQCCAPGTRKGQSARGCPVGARMDERERAYWRRRLGQLNRKKTSRRCLTDKGFLSLGQWLTRLSRAGDARADHVAAFIELNWMNGDHAGGGSSQSRYHVAICLTQYRTAAINSAMTTMPPRTTKPRRPRSLLFAGAKVGKLPNRSRG
jgi:hypothetical protein